MKTLGLLGGMSWESTLLYYQILNRRIRQTLGGLHSMPCIIHSFDFAQIAALQSSDDWNEASEVLANAACGLKAAGAEGIVLCTNTMHRCAPIIEEKSQLPLLHIADLTAQAILNTGLSKVALLGTRFTMEGEYYKDRLEKHFGLQVYIPDLEGRDQIHSIIYRELCNGVVKPESKVRYVEITNKLISQGAQCVILGCTEITMLVSQQDFSVPVFDTTAIHAEGAADWAISS